MLWRLLGVHGTRVLKMSLLDEIYDTLSSIKEHKLSMFVFVYVFVSTKIGHEYSEFFDIIPRPRPFKMRIFDTNTGIDAVGS